jgi:hypothetical protein
VAKPVKNVKVGNIQASIWENEVGKGKDAFMANSVTITKSYKKGDSWEQTSSFKISELPLVSLAVQKVLEWKYFKTDPNDVSFED